MPTIEDVAKLAGVSIATVSRVINGSGYVSERTRYKVWKAIEELGYKPEISAKILASKGKLFNVSIFASKRILSPLQNNGIIGEFYGVVIRAIEESCEKLGMKVDVKLLEDFSNSDNSDGYIFVGGDVSKEIVKETKSRKKPFVLVDHYIPGERVDCVISDGYDGALYATNYLISKGFTKIVHIHGPLWPYGFKMRYDGYKDAMEKAGLMPKFYECDDTEDGAKKVVDIMLNSYGVPEGIFTSNDSIAFWVINRLKEHGLKIPEDVSVIGFDDIVDAENFDPPLTTLRVFKYEMGCLACKRLHELLTKVNPHPVRILVFTQFVKRKSTK
ncbi:LacI family DNA-binding transcriptional regulator [Thermotoga sp. KOL6]|uniref:LacI family DNA-binding transcriptional regulator n=1 Tax=Thermotoga sp. KOL6 TaxID=126741 RepID=UPI000C766A6D|nr:LacI family DNA-binding transcriptional regulator [Thermotoga sp. KOL6]PLV60420.1 LacI family transcriptional regulator [Thermotoga sp. KOL6]